MGEDRGDLGPNWIGRTGKDHRGERREKKARMPWPLGSPRSAVRRPWVTCAPAPGPSCWTKLDGRTGKDLQGGVDERRKPGWWP